MTMAIDMQGLHVSLKEGRASEGEGRLKHQWGKKHPKQSVCVFSDIYTDYS